MMKRLTWVQALGIAGILLFLVGTYIGLFVAPAERHMGNVQRIMYVHLPSAWVSMLCFTAAFGFAIASLWTSKPRWDRAMVGAVEVGVVLNALLLAQGMIWARPTWGVWWDWDVRLTTSLVMLLLFAGVLVFRAFIEDPERRAAWSAVAAIISFVDVPLVYFCVRWWRSIHQIQSTPSTVDPAMVLPLRINSFAVLFIAIWLIAERARLEAESASGERVPEPSRLAPSEGVEHA